MFVPDNVLFKDGSGETVRSKLIDECEPEIKHREV
ncbi:MAG: hypothetical protein ACR2H4_20290 [Pyrinomonadaceae bacterium]